MTDNRTTELLPCPFCGGEARHYAPGPVEHHVECTNSKCYAVTHGWSSKEQAIEAWNTRHERTCTNAKKKWSSFAKYYFVCSECGWNLPDIGRDCIEIAAMLINRCPLCGASVIDTEGGA